MENRACGITEAAVAAYEAYQLGDTLSAPLATKEGQTVTLYAVWEKDAVRVTLMDAQDVNTVKYLIVRPGETYGKLPVLAKEGYTFDGWYSDSGMTVRVYDTTAVPAKDHHLYAKWLSRTEISVTAAGYDGRYDGQSHELKAVANKTLTAATYQWFRDGKAIVGATGSSYWVKNVADSGSYTAQVTELGNANYTLEGGRGVTYNWVIYEQGKAETEIPDPVQPEQPAPAATGIAVTPGSTTLNVGETAGLTYTVEPAGAGVTFRSSDTTVATVDENGVVTAVSGGTAVITVTTANGLTAHCTVTVKAQAAPETPRVTGITLKYGSYKFTKAGNTFNAGAQVLYVGDLPVEMHKVSFTSSNSAVATVDETGTVTAVGNGTATITATTVSGGYTAVCTVTVQIGGSDGGDSGSGGSGSGGSGGGYYPGGGSSSGGSTSGGSTSGGSGTNTGTAAGGNTGIGGSTSGGSAGGDDVVPTTTGCTCPCCTGEAACGTTVVNNTNCLLGPVGEIILMVMVAGLWVIEGVRFVRKLRQRKSGK